MYCMSVRVCEVGEVRMCGVGAVRVCDTCEGVWSGEGECEGVRS